MLKILIADDHAVVRGGLRQFLADVPDCRIAGEAGTGMETLALIRSEDWDLLLLDIGLPDLNGIEVLRRVKHEKPTLPVLIFSMFSEDDYAMAALEAGAIGYLPKDSPPMEILAAILRAGRGERYLSPALTEKLLAGTTHAGLKQPHDCLSQREFEVMRLLSRGMSLTDIGEALFLSPKTVSTYRARILEKLKLHSNAEVTRYVIEHKLDS
ncbi:MAG: vsrD2 [bacterium]|nr:MAG: vsrD2 [bacterium]KAF0148528.1 MAG: vsrD2 [bacterium]KAF0167252.1 MAG: vsrD2 [bacterium]TXT16423.1 MAG: vsrD2 [bacterium]